MALTDTKVRSAKPEAKEYSLVDGDGMSLLVKPTGSKYWRFRFRFGGKQHLMAFGVYPEISLANARQKREEARKLVAAGIDPREHKRALKEEQAKEIITFEKVAREWLVTNQKWSEDHANRVKKSLEDNIFPAIGTRNIAELGTRDLLIPIKAVETSGRLEVASRLQQRTTAIMRYAVQSGLIDYNPAQEMAGAVASGNRQHRPALELKRIPELLEKIDGYTGRPLTRWATELTLLIFTRNIDRSIWRDLMLKSGMLTLMDAEARSQWAKNLEEGDLPAISEANILSTFEQLHHNKQEVFERGIINVFKGLSWDYKTNNPCYFGKKIIVNNLGCVPQLHIRRKNSRIQPS